MLKKAEECVNVSRAAIFCLLNFELLTPHELYWPSPSPSMFIKCLDLKSPFHLQTFLRLCNSSWDDWIYFSFFFFFFFLSHHWGRKNYNNKKDTHTNISKIQTVSSTISLFSLIVNICQIWLNCNQKHVHRNGAGSINSLLWSALMSRRYEVELN